MNQKNRYIYYLILPLLVFSLAFYLRIVFFCGFVLGDDLEEFALIHFIKTHGPIWGEQLHLRFGVWLIFYFFLEIFGPSEFSYFLPTWLMSSSFAVFAYLLMLRWRYTPLQAFWAGVFVASAPFEVLMGTIHSNDLVLAWCLGFSLLLFFYLDKKPVLNYGLIAGLLWFGFYTKLWVVYVFPALGIYFLYEGFKLKKWAGLVSFSLVSIVLHSATAFFWYLKVGEFLPFLSKHAASYPYRELADSLAGLFWQYPEIIFKGSELGNSLFGLVPHLLIVLLGIKGVLYYKFPEKAELKFGRPDIILLGFYGSFFLFLNFFPNSFKFDQFYSAPRIFRYLTPLSFAASLHAGKIFLDLLTFSRNLRKPVFAGLSVLFLLFLGLNVFYSAEATGPGRVQRTALKAVVQDIKKNPPPVLITEYWIGHFIREVYLRDERRKIKIPLMVRLANFRDYEEWLKTNQEGLTEGTMLISGLASYVYYGAHYDGFRLAHFDQTLDPRWEVVREYNTLNFLPIPEPARLWRWTGGESPGFSETSRLEAVPLKPDANPRTLFEQGMKAFDSGNCPEAQGYFQAIIEKFPRHSLAADGRYFKAICFFRDGQWEQTVDGFLELIESNPESIWVAGAHFHMGLSFLQLGEKAKAEHQFRTVIEDFPQDEALSRLAREQLDNLPRENDRGLFGKFLDLF